MGLSVEDFNTGRCRKTPGGAALTGPTGNLCRSAV